VIQQTGWRKMKKPKVVHILANGKKVKSVKGRIVPAENPVYEVMIQIYKGENE